MAANEQQQQAEARAEELKVEFADLMAARPPKGPTRAHYLHVSLQKEVRKRLSTPGGRDMLYGTSLRQPMHALLPRSVRLDLMLSQETRELRRSARDLCALLSPDSPALSLVLPLRDRHTVAEYQQELQQIHEHVTATCKHSLRNLHFRTLLRTPMATDLSAELQAAVRHFLHGLLTSLDQVTVLRVECLDHLITDQTLGLLGSSQKNLRNLGVTYTGHSEFTAAGLRALTPGCPKLEVLEVSQHYGDPLSLSPEVVAVTLQELPSLRVLDTDQSSTLGGMVRYASDPANPPHPLHWDFVMLGEQREHVWGGHNWEPLLAAFPNRQNMIMRPVTDAYTDVMVSRLDSLEFAEFGTASWSLSAQTRFFGKFTTLTHIALTPQNNTPLVVDLGVIGMNCLALEVLRIVGATFRGSKVDPRYFQKLKGLTLSAPRNQPARLPDAFLKLLLSGPRLGSVDLQNFEVADQLVLELCQEQGEQHGAFSQLASLHVTGQGWPGLCASTVVRLACRAPNLDTLNLSVRQWGGGEAPVRDGLVLSAFFKNHMGSVRYLPVE